MVKKKVPVVWDVEARNSFRKAITYIRKSSVQNAEKVRLDINAAVRKLADEPERRHTPDKYKIPNDGNYRAFEIHHYRIAYSVSDEMIRIVRFRHTSQQPETY